MSDRPKTYSPELGRLLCEAVASSQDGLRKTCDSRAELPAFSTVQGWLRDHADLAVQYARAKRTQLEAMAEDIVDIGRDDSIDPADKRIRIDSMKWLLSKLIPRTYGDKLDVTSDGAALATPPHLIDARVQSIIMQARERKRGEVIDLDPEAIRLLE